MAKVQKIVIVVGLATMDAYAVTSTSAADHSIEISDGLVDVAPYLSPSVRRKATEGQVNVDGNPERWNDLVGSMSKPSPSLVRKAAEGQVTPDGSNEISNGFIDSTSRLSTSLVRKATEAQVISDANIEVSQSVVNVTSKLFSNVTRKVTQGQVTADGSIQIFNGLGDSTSRQSTSLVRKAPEGQVDTDDSIEISNSVVNATSKLLPNDTRKVTQGQVTADGSIQIFDSLADLMPRPSTSLVRKAPEGQVDDDGSIKISKSSVVSMHKLSRSIAREGAEGQLISGLESSDGFVDFTLDLSSGVTRKRKETHHHQDTGADLEPSAAPSEDKSGLEAPNEETREILPSGTSSRRDDSPDHRHEIRFFFNASHDAPLKDTVSDLRHPYVQSESSTISELAQTVVPAASPALASVAARTSDPSPENPPATASAVRNKNVTGIRQSFEPAGLWRTALVLALQSQVGPKVVRLTDLLICVCIIMTICILGVVYFPRFFRASADNSSDRPFVWGGGRPRGSSDGLRSTSTGRRLSRPSERGRNNRSRSPCVSNDSDHGRGSSRLQRYSAGVK